MRIFTIFFGIVTFLLNASSYAEEKVTAEARLDSTAFLIGDPIRVSTSIRHPKGFRVAPLIGDTFGSFIVLQPPLLREETDTTTSGVFVVARYDSGRALLPPVLFTYNAPGETVSDTVRTQPLALTIYLAEVDTTQPIKDLKPPIEIPMSIEDIVLIIGGILIGLTGAFFLYRFWKKRKKQPEDAPAVLDQKAAHLIAFDEFARLKEKRLWQQGMVKQFYSELTEILRRYFENQYGVRALEQTTEEIIASLRKSIFPVGLLPDLEKVMMKADLVKFAKLSPSVDEHEEAFVDARSIVEKTTLFDIPVMARVGEEVREHAGV